MINPLVGVALCSDGLWPRWCMQALEMYYQSEMDDLGQLTNDGGARAKPY